MTRIAKVLAIPSLLLVILMMQIALAFTTTQNITSQRLVQAANNLAELTAELNIQSKQLLEQGYSIHAAATILVEKGLIKKFIDSLIDYILLEKEYLASKGSKQLLYLLEKVEPEFDKAASIVTGLRGVKDYYKSAQMEISLINKIDINTLKTMRQAINSREVQILVAEYILHHTRGWLIANEYNSRVPTPFSTTTPAVFYGSFNYYQVTDDITGTLGQTRYDCSGYPYNINGGNNLYKVVEHGKPRYTVFELHFRDEDNPYPRWDSFWDNLRRIIYGRIEDVEVVKVVPALYSSNHQDEIVFDDTYSNGKTFAYVHWVAGIPFGYHGTATISTALFTWPQPLYVANTWNHMMDLINDN